MQTPKATQLTLQELMFRASTVIEKEEDVTREQMTENRVTTLTGWGKIIDPHHVELTDVSGRKKSMKPNSFVSQQEVVQDDHLTKIYRSRMD